MTERSETQQLIDSFTGNNTTLVIYKTVVDVVLKPKRIREDGTDPCEIILVLSQGKDKWITGRPDATDEEMIGLALTIVNEINRRY